MKRAVLAAAVVAVGVGGCGGGGDEKVAITPGAYQALLGGPLGFPEVADAMRGGAPKADVARLASVYRERLESWRADLDNVRPPANAEYGHELLVEAVGKRAAEVASAVGDYKASMTVDAVERLLARLDLGEGARELLDARYELEDVGYAFGR
jgi:hypothetical protein